METLQFKPTYSILKYYTIYDTRYKITYFLLRYFVNSNRNAPLLIIVDLQLQNSNKVQG
jgi:hypothetical protein